MLCPIVINQMKQFYKDISKQVNSLIFIYWKWYHLICFKCQLYIKIHWINFHLDFIVYHDSTFVFVTHTANLNTLYLTEVKINMLCPIMTITNILSIHACNYLWHFKHTFSYQIGPILYTRNVIWCNWWEDMFN